MSITPKKESDSNNNNSNVCTSEEPKLFQEQRSLLEPSTELGSKSYLYNIFIAGINEITRTEMHNSGSAFRLNSSYNNILPSSFFPQCRLSIDEEESADMIPEDYIFESDEYYNNNYILNPYFNRQFVPLTYEGITDTVNSILTSEK